MFFLQNYDIEEGKHAMLGFTLKKTELYQIRPMMSKQIISFLPSLIKNNYRN